MPKIGDELREVMGIEIEKMSGPEAVALFRELSAVITRKLEGYKYQDSHAVALGAVVLVITMLIRSMSRSEGVRSRLRACVIGMLKADVSEEEL